MHLPEKEDAAHEKTRGSAEKKTTTRTATYPSSAVFANEPAPIVLQVDRLLRRFSISPPVARVVAELAWRAA